MVDFLVSVEMARLRTWALDRQIHLEVVPLEEPGSSVAAYLEEACCPGVVDRPLEEQQTLVELDLEVGHLAGISLPGTRYLVAGDCLEVAAVEALGFGVGVESVEVAGLAMGELFGVVLGSCLERFVGVAAVGFGRG